MKEILIYPAGTTEASRYAAEVLHNQKIPIVDHPTPEVTHLLLDVPSFDPSGNLRGGGTVKRLLEMLPPDITVVGGNLNHPALLKHKTVDFLRSEAYLAANAAITAECALRVALPVLKTTLSDSPALVIGWGRIGKCLGKLLKALGCSVTVAVRKEKDLAMLRALQYEAVDRKQVPAMLSKYRLIFNTAPEPILDATQLGRSNAVKIDLASHRGLDGSDVIWARGLPGIHAPESSGKLIAQTLIHYIKEET